MERSEEKYLKRKREIETEPNKLLSIHLSLANRYLAKEQYEFAIDEYTSAGLLYLQQNDLMEYGRMQRMVGEAYLNLHQYEKALNHANVYLKIAKEQENKVEEQRAQATIGHTYLLKCLENCDEIDQNSVEAAKEALLSSLKLGFRLEPSRDRTDMLGRAYLNLGLLYEYADNNSSAIDQIQRSISFFKEIDSYEQLYRSCTAISSIYIKEKKYSSAIDNLNLAVDVAGHLSEQISLKANALNIKGEVLVQLADFQSAKSVLAKAYRLNTPVKVERKAIEENLRVVAAMCRTEKALLNANESDYKLRKKLYEKMGDGACILKNFEKAIEYYKKMLECTENCGTSAKEFSSCYVSLAQTYKDNSQFDLAIEYFQKEKELWEGDVKEQISSIFNIVDCMDSDGRNFFDMQTQLNEARLECSRVGDKNLEGKVLNKLVGLMRKHNRFCDVEQFEMELSNFDCNDSESDDGIPEVTENIGDEIDLDNLSDLSDTSDNETKRSRRRISKPNLHKRNMKGEYPLHIACINKNLTLVKKLIDQKHVINVRDNSGWLPIHEACNHGDLEIVKLLLENGALINDRGGQNCGGITPLHDAASNGHLDIMEYLMDQNASVVAKTDQGLTALDLLKQWREGQELDPITETHYERVVQRLTRALLKVGHNVTSGINNKENRLKGTNSQNILKQISHDTRIESRRNALCLEYDDFTSVGNKRVVNDYRSTIENFRNRNNTSKNYIKRKSLDTPKIPALIPSDEIIIDDFIEDDMQSNLNKKRRTENQLTLTTSIRKSKSPIRQKKNKKQTKLTNAGFTMERSISPSIPIQNSSQISANLKTQCKLTGFATVEVDSTLADTIEKIPAIESTFSSPKQSKMLSIDVSIEEKLFRVPIPAHQADTLTIKWLADEAARRFYKKEAMKPTIELYTSNGAMLCDEDFISILFSNGGMQGEEVKAKVIKWNTPPLTERYKDACEILQIDVNEKLLEQLEMSSTTLNLSNLNLRNKLGPLCKALHRQTFLYELNLSGNRMGDKCIELLCKSFTSLNSLISLDLSSNQLSAKSLSHISEHLKDSNPLTSLTKLKLSFNPLGDESFKHLSEITNELKLKTLCLVNVDFSSNLFGHLRRDLSLNFTFLEYLDISYNNLSEHEISRFISWLKPNIVKHLNVGNNDVSEGGVIVEHFSIGCSFLNLETLNLSRCKLTDEDVLKLTRLFEDAHIEDLDLSCNNITEQSLKRLLQETSPININVAFCEKLKENIDDTWTLNSLKNRSLKSSLDYIDNFGECDVLINLWKKAYQEKAVVDGFYQGLLHLHVNSE